MAKPKLESAVERRFVELLNRHGVTHVKLNLTGRRGWPDRLIVLPRGQCLFVELKRKGAEARRLQLHIHEQLDLLGHHVVVLDDPDEAMGYVLMRAKLAARGGLD